MQSYLSVPATASGRHTVGILLLTSDTWLIEVVLGVLADTPMADDEFVHVASLANGASRAMLPDAEIVLAEFDPASESGNPGVDEIARLWPGRPIIALAPLHDPAVVEKAIARGFSDCLTVDQLSPPMVSHVLVSALARNTRGESRRDTNRGYLKLMEDFKEALILCDGAGKILFANPTAMLTFGPGVGPGIVGHDFGDLVSPPERERVSRLFNEGVQPESPGPHILECRLEPAQGIFFDAEIVASGILYRGRAAVELIVRDVGERIRDDKSNRLASAIFDNSGEAMMITDEKNRIVAVNPAFSRITGYSVTELIGCSPNVLASGRHDSSFYRSLWKTLLETGCWQGEVWNRRKNGEPYLERLTITLVRDAKGRIVNHVAVFSDITEEKLENDRIQLAATHDALTKLPNRRLLQDRMTQAIASASRQHRPLAVMFVDLDGFKPVNDRFGHLAGDKVLVAVAERLRACVRQSDTVARLGGDEFVLLLGNLSHLDDSARIAEKIRSVLREPIVLGEFTVTVGASIGIAHYPLSGTSPEALLTAADQAMYACKREHKGNYPDVAMPGDPARTDKF